MQGHRPIALNAHGRHQVATTAEAISHLQAKALVSSPVHRALETARILADHLSFDPDAIDTHDGFAEFEMGDWEGQTFAELWEAGVIQDYWRDPTHTRFPGGESMPIIQARAVAALCEVVATHSGGTIVVSTHGGIVRLLLLAALGLPRSQYFDIAASNASLARIQLSPGRRPKVHNINYIPGLPKVPWKE